MVGFGEEVPAFRQQPGPLHERRRDEDGSSIEVYTWHAASHVDT